MNAHEVLSLNPRPIPNKAQPPASAPEAADWLKHPSAVIKRVTLAMRLAADREYDPAIDGPEE